MTDVKALRGSCLCGGVAFAIEGRTGPIGQCHCSRCRKASGTDGNAVFYTGAANLRWEQGEELVRTFVVPGSDGWTSTFCATCGSPVPHRDPAGKIWFVPAGLLDTDFGEAGYAAHIHVGSKADWTVLGDAAPQYQEGFGSERVDQPASA